MGLPSGSRTYRQNTGRRLLQHRIHTPALIHAGPCDSRDGVLMKKQIKGEAIREGGTSAGQVGYFSVMLDGLRHHQQVCAFVRGNGAFLAAC